MIIVLTKALAFILIIILGYLLKKIGFFEKKDYKIISKIMINITLPAAIITAYDNFKINNSLLFVVLLGFLFNVIMLSLGYFVSKNKEKSTRAYYMLNFPGYNIGSFTLPYVQSFLGSFGVIITCMFDTGNAIMCTGGSYAITSSVTGTEKGGGIKEIAKKLLSSTPFVVYMSLLLTTMLGIRIPKVIISITSVVGAANAFLAMLAIGMMFELNFEMKYFKHIAVTLLVRYIMAAVFSALIYFYMPFSKEIRQVLAIVLFAPIPSLSPVFTERCCGDGSVASVTNSISIVLSIAIITTVLMFMNI
ncbi:AEC family transporter [Clostridium sp. SYSU_GA19001]|uniref:AEC family transporter n=1 Tax=Clostridium caldaquaticum TaxID=2940653 RepID=UPI0020778E58|nr:AEC family transporter [Clostridium caldaquaticum]MCM8709853.1 AEC family transporter [Clostridium caldaquaticum]